MSRASTSEFESEDLCDSGKDTFAAQPRTDAVLVAAADVALRRFSTSKIADTSSARCTAASISVGAAVRM